jgi:hypothetical protein
MRALLVALLLMFGSQAGAECGNLCDYIWWTKATEADVKVKLDKGINPKNGYIRSNKKGLHEASLLIACVWL